MASIEQIIDTAIHDAFVGIITLDPKRSPKARFRQVTYTLSYDNLESSKLVKIRGGSFAI
jgi:hypothetical protein